MGNNWFRFKKFEILQERSAFRVGTDGVMLGAWCNLDGSDRVLDIGTGTGLIALMIAQRSSAGITAIEPDRESSSEAESNFRNSPWSGRLELINTTLQEYSLSGPGKFNHIVANPPYFIESMQSSESRLSAARHDISLTLADLVRCSALLLAPNGKISVIMPYAEGNMLIAEAAGHSLFCSRITKVKPLPDKPVKRLLIELTDRVSEPKSDFIVIERGHRHDYTSEYRELTKDFYLNF